MRKKYANSVFGAKNGVNCFDGNTGCRSFKELTGKNVKGTKNHYYGIFSLENSIFPKIIGFMYF